MSDPTGAYFNTRKILNFIDYKTHVLDNLAMELEQNLYKKYLGKKVCVGWFKFKVLNSWEDIEEYLLNHESYFMRSEIYDIESIDNTINKLSVLEQMCFNAVNNEIFISFEMFKKYKMWEYLSG